MAKGLGRIVISVSACEECYNIFHFPPHRRHHLERYNFLLHQCFSCAAYLYLMKSVSAAVSVHLLKEQQQQQRLPQLISHLFRRSNFHDGFCD